MLAGWRPADILLRGEMVYRNDQTGELALEREGQRLVSLDRQDEKAIRRILMLDQQVVLMSQFQPMNRKGLS